MTNSHPAILFSFSSGSQCCLFAMWTNKNSFKNFADEALSTIRVIWVMTEIIYLLFSSSFVLTEMQHECWKSLDLHKKKTQKLFAARLLYFYWILIENRKCECFMYRTTKSFCFFPNSRQLLINFQLKMKRFFTLYNHETSRKTSHV